MNKKIVIELSREDARFVRQVLAFYEGYHLQNDMLQGKCKRLREYVLESEKADRSVIEWHSKKEKPTYGRDIVIRHLDQSFDAYKVGVFILDTWDKSQNIESWAHLPEGGE